MGRVTGIASRFMAWDFETDPEFRTKLDWVDEFVREEVEPLDLVLGEAVRQVRPAGDCEIIRPLQEQVRDHGLWACHLGPDLGGPGYGQVKLALLNEILGRSQLGADRCSAARRPTPATPRSSPTTAPHEQKERYLQPLLDGEIVSCYSMTEPQAGADPTLFTTRRRAATATSG